MNGTRTDKVSSHRIVLNMPAITFRLSHHYLLTFGIGKFEMFNQSEQQKDVEPETEKQKKKNVEEEPRFK